MPELPEVETVRNTLKNFVLNKKIESIDVIYPKIIEDDAANVLPNLEGPYDVVFLDAAKGQYIQFLPHILRLLPIGGILIADDVLQGGDIARSSFTVLFQEPFWIGVAERWDGAGYRAASRVLLDAYRRAAELRPDFDRHVRDCLDELSALEAERCPSMDRAADTFARILQSAAATVDDPVRRRVLEQMFYHLGRWIYLVDAADDLREDAAAGRYNPVALRYGLTDGKWTEESRQAFAKTLDQSVHMIATAFELWDFGVWRPLLENTVYTALFAVGRAVLEGTFRRRSPKRREKETQEG